MQEDKQEEAGAVQRLMHASDAAAEKAAALLEQSAKIDAEKAAHEQAKADAHRNK